MLLTIASEEHGVQVPGLLMQTDEDQSQGATGVRSPSVDSSLLFASLSTGASFAPVLFAMVIIEGLSLEVWLF